jgi:Caspase domain
MTRRYRAMLVGNARYPRDPAKLRTLTGPVYDVPLLYGALVDRDRGLFDRADVAIRNESTSTDLLRDLTEFFDGATPDDVLLLYHSAHGVRDSSGTLYLCTRDTVTARLSTTSISSRQLDELIDGSAAALTVVVLDCCHSGAFRDADIVRPLGGRGRYVLASCRDGELASDVSQLNHASHFTEALAAGLRGEAGAPRTTGLLSLDELYSYVYERMTTHGLQTPQRSVRGEGEMAIARLSPTPPSTVPPRHRENGRRRRAVIAGALAGAALIGGVAMVPVFRPDPDATGHRPSPSSPHTGVDDESAADYPNPPWYPADATAARTPPPYDITIESPHDRATVPGPCLRVTGTGNPPADVTLIVADRNIDGAPGRPFIYTPVVWNDSGWYAEIALGTAPGQEYELAVLVADRDATRTAWSAVKGTVTSTTFISGLQLAALMKVTQRTAAGPPCGA